MAFDPPEPVPAILDKYYLNAFPPPADGVFELGLVLGGTVSAGAFTAGVLDFLVFALDTWRAEVEKDLNAPGGIQHTVPHHSVILKAIGGTSGGAVCAGTVSVLAGLDFPHATGPSQAEAADPDLKAERDRQDSRNPLYNLWVNTLDIKGMLGTADLGKGRPVRSVLNAFPIEQARRDLLAYAAPQRKTPRDWLSPDLQTIITVTNLRGVPYEIGFTGGRQYYYDHADYARFLVRTRPGAPPQRDDAFEFDTGTLKHRARLADFAVASGAFPIGFPVRALSLPLSQYTYRVRVVVDNDNLPKAVPLKPWWRAMATDPDTLPDRWEFPAYDGGVIDNQPIELVRTALAGAIGHNPRDGLKAKRAVLLIDPFCEDPTLGPKDVGGLVAMGLSLVDTMKTQGRYASADLTLAADDDVFSRFMITAERNGAFGSKAIACAGLAAFQGFLCRDFRLHDYMLGRHSAWSYLKTTLTLPEHNPLFNGDPFWSKPEGKSMGVQKKIGIEYPIVPLVGTAATEPERLDWPKGTLDPQTLREPIRKRIDAVLTAIADEQAPLSFENLAKGVGWSNAALRAWLQPVLLLEPGKAADAAIEKIRASLDQNGLGPPESHDR